MLVLAVIIDKIIDFLCTSVTLAFFHIITAVPFFYIARNAHMRRPWLAFIPFGKEYIAFTIPSCKYKLGFINTDRRRLMFGIYLIPEIIYLYLNNILISRSLLMLSTLFDFSNLGDVIYLPQFIGENLFSEPIYVIILLVFLIVVFIFWLLRAVLGWRKNYDLLRTYYDMKKHALWASVANIFCPLVMFVFSYILINKIPNNEDSAYYSEKQL